MPFLDLDPGGPLYYREAGPGGSPAVLLLHGLGSTGSAWAYQLPPLRRSGYRILAPDLRGFGKSPYAGTSYSFQRLFEEIRCLIHAAGAEPAVCVGVSLGGLLGQMLAIEAPTLVRGLVLVNSAATLRPQQLTTAAYYGLRFVLLHLIGLPAQARLVSRRIFPGTHQARLRSILYEQILLSDPRAYRKVMQSLLHYDVRHRLGEIRCPTLVLTGEQDTTIPRSRQTELAAGIPGARWLTIPGAGHALPVEAPEQFNAALLSFLDGLPEEASEIGPAASG